MNKHSQYPRPVATLLLRAEIEYVANDVIKEYGFDSSKEFSHHLAYRIGATVRFGLDHSIVREEGSLTVNGSQDFEIRLPWGAGILRSNFLCAHELGHYFLHTGKPYGLIPIQAMHYINPVVDDLQIEREANYFAYCLLMPREGFIKSYLKNYGDVLEVCGHFNVDLKQVRARWKYLNRPRS